MNKTITLRDIAKALNLSVSTVSRALTDSYQIGNKTKQVVLAYAKKHNYVVNRFAKGLKEGKSRTIGVVVCSIDNNFVAQMLDGIDNFFSEKDYQIIIMQSKENREQELACINLLHSNGIDGLLIAPSYQTKDFEFLKSLQKEGIPVVLFDRITDQIETHKVACNSYDGAYLATKHLIEAGFKNICQINSQTKHLFAIERFEGYKKALKDAGLLFNQDLVKYCDTTYPDQIEENLDKIIKDLFASNNPPDALFTTTDLLTINCLAIINRQQIKVGLIGFSNTNLADMLSPSLSTICQPAYQIGNLAAQQLFSLIKRKDESDFETILLPTSMQIRRSSQIKV